MDKRRQGGQIYSGSRAAISSKLSVITVMDIIVFAKAERKSW